MYLAQTLKAPTLDVELVGTSSHFADVSIFVACSMNKGAGAGAGYGAGAGAGVGLGVVVGVGVNSMPLAPAPNHEPCHQK
jgi:hypothetical protein